MTHFWLNLFLEQVPLDGSGHLPLCIALRDGLPLVVAVLPFSHGEVDLHVATSVVHPQRDERYPWLVTAPGELGDLACMRQQLPWPYRVVVVAVTGVVWRDVRVVEPELTAV